MLMIIDVTPCIVLVASENPLGEILILTHATWCPMFEGSILAVDVVTFAYGTAKCTA